VSAETLDLLDSDAVRARVQFDDPTLSNHLDSASHHDLETAVVRVLTAPAPRGRVQLQGRTDT
jgi:hypothetical protein